MVGPEFEGPFSLVLVKLSGIVQGSMVLKLTSAVGLPYTLASRYL